MYKIKYILQLMVSHDLVSRAILVIILALIALIFAGIFYLLNL